MKGLKFLLFGCMLAMCSTLSSVQVAVASPPTDEVCLIQSCVLDYVAPAALVETMEYTFVLNGRSSDFPIVSEAKKNNLYNPEADVWRYWCSYRQLFKLNLYQATLKPDPVSKGFTFVRPIKLC